MYGEYQSLVAIITQCTNQSGQGGRGAGYVTLDLSYDQEGERKIRAKIIDETGKRS